jgi:hypothetical protein
MADPLATYLHDHMAVASFANDLLQAMKERQIKEPCWSWSEMPWPGGFRREAAKVALKTRSVHLN